MSSLSRANGRAENRSLTTSVTLRGGLVAALLACLLASGCAGISQGEDKYTIKNVIGKMAGQVSQPRNPDGSLKPLEGQAEFDKVRELVDNQKYAEAEAGFAALAKKYKDKPIEEDCMFYVAECQFLQKHYAAAQDSIDELLNKYTGSRYIEKSTQRLFAIANIWLNAPKPAAEVELAAYQKGELKKDLPSPDKQEPASTRVLPNFFDSSRPIFDTSGNALKALKTIWLKDPTGPLADDALMMTATYFLRQKDFREADHYFTTLRESYPKSDHIQLAYVLGSHAKMMTYQGPLYDGKALEEARKLTQATIKLFPKSPQRKQLDQDLAAMKVLGAQRDWAMAELYMRKGLPKSAAMYCRSLVDDHPRTAYADKARNLLAEIDPKAGRVIQAGGTLPVQRHPQAVTAMNESDPTCAAPGGPGRGANPSSTGATGRARLGTPRTAARDTDEFNPAATGRPAASRTSIPEELPDLDELPRPSAKVPAPSRSAAPRKEPQRIPIDELEEEGLPERLVPTERTARPVGAPLRKAKPLPEPEE